MLCRLFPVARSVRFTRSFSSLKTALTEELNEEKTNCELTSEFEDLRSKILQQMTLHEKPGMMNVILQSQFQNQDIEIAFNCEETVDEEDEQDSEQEVEDEEPAEDEEIVESWRVPFTATISQENKALVFDCIADGDYLTVERVGHMEEPAMSDDEQDDGFDDMLEESNIYAGPYFEDLDETLQDEFLQYLGERNINDELATFISQYAEIKEQKEYVGFLENASKFIN